MNKPELQELHEGILRMGVLVEEALRKVLYALETRDYDLAEEIIRADRRIDELENWIDDACMQIIVSEHPADRYLRDVLSTAKIGSALERIGDHARHIAGRARVITDSAFIRTLPLIRRMTETNIAMLHDFLTAYIEADADRAREVAARDAEIDRIHDELTDLIVGIMRRAPHTIEKGLELMLVNRFLVRFGDQVTNMCEHVVFVNNADHVQLNDTAQ